MYTHCTIHFVLSAYTDKLPELLCMWLCCASNEGEVYEKFVNKIHAARYSMFVDSVYYSIALMIGITIALFHMHFYFILCCHTLRSPTLYVWCFSLSLFLCVCLYVLYWVHVSPHSRCFGAFFFLVATVVQYGILLLYWCNVGCIACVGDSNWCEFVCAYGWDRMLRIELLVHALLAR